MIASHQEIATRVFSVKQLLMLGAATLLSFSSGTYATTCFNYTGAIENWSVPAGVGTITAEAWGAQGGNSTWNTPLPGGLGAYVKGNITVTSGDQLKVFVGGQGESLAVGGGGGGSFLTTSNDTPLLVAGGGGGASSDQNGIGGVTTEDGTMDSLGLIAGGTGGAGGNVCSSNDNDGGGGGGFFSDGADANSGTGNGGFGGIAFVNGGTIVQGGRLDSACTNDPAGGFGGGGSASCNTVGGGGGGGYSGGAGGPHTGNCSANLRAGGGGGGSFNSGTEQTNTAATNTGNGQICITVIPQLSVTTVGQGTVISNPPGINCGGDSTCLAGFVEGTPVNLTADYDPLWEDGSWTWSGDCFGGAGCSFAMTSDKAARVDFYCLLDELQTAPGFPIDSSEPAWMCYDLDTTGIFEVIGPTGDVTFVAENSIRLGAGFKIGNGARFNAVISP